MNLNITSLQYIIPEVILTGFVVIVVLADLLPKVKKGSLGVIAFGGLVAALAAILYGPVGGKPASAMPLFYGMFSYDAFSIFFKFAFVVATMVIVLFSIPIIRRWSSGAGEYYALLLSCTLGMCLMAGSNDLLMMYLSLEFVSVTSYIMAGLLRHNRKSAEASLKYIIYGAAASGMMVYGISLLYGAVGSTNMVEISQKIGQVQMGSTFVLITSVLVMAGFAYKIAAVPFHMWCPDVYEGAPTPITAFFSVGPKAAGFAMLIRFLLGVYPPTPTGGGFEWKLIMGILCVLTMALGNLAALQQQNLKRLMAYSSIAHAGYMLLAFSVFTVHNIASVMFYIVMYLMMNLGAFLVVIVLEDKFGIETVDGCKGLGWRHPTLCVMMAIFLFSLTGLPPFAGFAGKLLIFSYTIEGGAYGVMLVVLGALFSVVSLYYYARIVGAMFLKTEVSGQRTVDSEQRVSLYNMTLLWLLAIPTVFFGLYFDPIYNFAFQSAKQILGTR